MNSPKILSFHDQSFLLGLLATLRRTPTTHTAARIASHQTSNTQLIDSLRWAAAHEMAHNAIHCVSHLALAEHHIAKAKLVGNIDPNLLALAALLLRSEPGNEKDSQSNIA